MTRLIDGTTVEASYVWPADVTIRGDHARTTADGIMRPFVEATVQGIVLRGEGGSTIGDAEHACWCAYHLMEKVSF